MEQKILHVVSTFGYGGVSKFILNYYEEMDQHKIKFDIISHGKREKFHDEFTKNGNKIFYIKTLRNQNIFSYINNGLKIIEKNGPYKAIHVHTDYQSGLYTLIAKIAGIEIRISHSHRIDAPNKIGNKLLPLFKKLISVSSTDCLASSREAGEFLFNNNNFIVMNNAINLEDYTPLSNNEKDKIKNELKVPLDWEGIIIGHVGSFTRVKNQAFFIPIIDELNKRDIEFKIIFVGDGELREEVESKINQTNYYSNVIFTGIRSDVAGIMQLLDVFVLPSQYEGLGIVALEAQACGIPCVLSSTVPIDADMELDLVKYLSLQADIPVWVDTIISQAKSGNEKEFEQIKNTFFKNGFSIKTEKNKLLDIYKIE